MFLIVFIRNKHLSQVTKVRKMDIAKGKSMLFMKAGNKGAVAYTFCLANRWISIIAPHLQHKAEKQDKRNEMSQELVNEFKMQDV
jgi:hypothetical protein